MLGKLKALFTFDHIIKIVIALSLVCIAQGVNANPLSGHIGIGTDNIFRGNSLLHDGSNRSLSGALNWDSDFGLHANLNVSEVDFGDGSADHQFMGILGFAKALSDDLTLGVAYMEHGFRGSHDWDNMKEIKLHGKFHGLKFAHHLGQDDAKDYTELGYDLLGLALTYGIAEDHGHHYAIAKNIALTDVVHIKAGWVSFFADDNSLAEDEDSLFVSFNYHF